MWKLVAALAAVVVIGACSPQLTAAHFNKPVEQVTPADQAQAWQDYVAAVDRVHHDDPWAVCIRGRESGNYASNTGNGYYGAYQYDRQTWNSAAIATGWPWLADGRADLHTQGEQDAVTYDYARQTRGQPWAGDFRYCGRP